MKREFLSLLLSIAILSMVVARARATWPLNGTALSVATNDQELPTIVSDGTGGAIVTWQDKRNGADYDIYAQRIDAAGNTLWNANGVALCTAAGNQDHPTIVSDGAGGAIVTWEDKRSGFYDIYARRISAAGTALWSADGAAVCTINTDGAPQTLPTIVSDGAGGAIITWTDYRLFDQDIYAQRIDASGVTLWTTDGVAVCTATSNQFNPTIASDGASGAIITWVDYRSFTSYDIYARRIDALGTALWTANGVALSTASNNQESPDIVSDGAGGAIVTWQHLGATAYDIYARRVDAAGTALWTANGVALCTAIGDQQNPRITSDGVGGAIVCWQDSRSDGDVYVRRINAAGTALWATNGIALCTATNHQDSPSITSDGAGGAVVTWHDFRSGVTDIYARGVDATGNAIWATDGVALCTAANSQQYPVLTSDGAGGAIVAWQDMRSGISDIYAQRISAAGTIPTGVGNNPTIAGNVALRNFPNPFSASTEVRLRLPAASRVEIDVFDVAGRRVRHEAIDGAQGWQRIQWDGRDGVGRRLASGVYFYTVRAAGETITRKMVIER